MSNDKIDDPICGYVTILGTIYEHREPYRAEISSSIHADIDALMAMATYEAMKFVRAYEYAGIDKIIIEQIHISEANARQEKGWT